jgi:hypothetical protein
VETDDPFWFDRRVGEDEGDRKLGKPQFALVRRKLTVLRIADLSAGRSEGPVTALCD